MMMRTTTTMMMMSVAKDHNLLKPQTPTFNCQGMNNNQLLQVIGLYSCSQCMSALRIRPTSLVSIFDR